MNGRAAAAVHRDQQPSQQRCFEPLRTFGRQISDKAQSGKHHRRRTELCHPRDWDLPLPITFPPCILPPPPPHTFPRAPRTRGAGKGQGVGATPSQRICRGPAPPGGHIWRHIWAGAAPPRGHIWRRRGAAQRRGGRSGGRRSPAAGRGGQSRRGAEGRERRPDGAAGPQPGPAPAAAAAGAGARLDLPGGAAGRRQVGEVPSSVPSPCTSPCHPPPGLVINFLCAFLPAGRFAPRIKSPPPATPA